MQPHILDYAPAAESAPGLTRLGRFCIALMASFLLLDAVLFLGRGSLPDLVYQPLCFLSLGGFVAGAMGVGVAAMDIREFRWQVLLSALAVLCVLVTMVAPLYFTT